MNLRPNLKAKCAVLLWSRIIFLTTLLLSAKARSAHFYLSSQHARKDSRKYRDSSKHGVSSGELSQSFLSPNAIFYGTQRTSLVMLPQLCSHPFLSKQTWHIAVISQINPYLLINPTDFFEHFLNMQKLRAPLVLSQTAFLARRAILYEFASWNK